MNNQQLAILANIQAAVARIKGMEAANQLHVVSGGEPKYSESDFWREANHLDHLAVQALNLPE